MSYWHGRTILSVFVLLIGGCAGAAGAGSDRPKISLKTARQLVYEGLRVYSPGSDFTRVDVSRIRDNYDREFFYFEATWPNPTGSPHLGSFAVNPWTGDVWNAAGCERLTSASLARLQDGIRKRFGFKEKEYSALRARKPLCGVDGFG
jgi:hypothetical protein